MNSFNEWGLYNSDISKKISRIQAFFFSIDNSDSNNFTLLL